MTDQNFHEELRATIRDAVASYLDTCTGEELRELATESLLSAPPRPTLADITDDERLNAVGMWADVDGFHPYRAVIDGIPAPKVPVFRPTAGSLDWVHPEDVTPLPELGRAWSPGGSPTCTPAPAPALPEGWRVADHQKYGRVIVTNTTPNRGGHVYFVAPATGPLGNDWHRCTPDELTYLDQGADTPTASGVPAVGTVIQSADDPRIDALPVGSIMSDRDGDTVNKRSEAWEGDGYIPNPEECSDYGPWKVLHIPKGAGQ